MTLEPLSQLESEELIENLLGDSTLDDDARARIRETAEGNPLFVEQLLAMLADGGDPGHVPPTIHALLEARLDALPEAERHVSSGRTSSGRRSASSRPTADGPLAPGLAPSCGTS